MNIVFDKKVGEKSIFLGGAEGWSGIGNCFQELYVNNCIRKKKDCVNVPVEEVWGASGGHGPSRNNLGLQKFSQNGLKTNKKMKSIEREEINFGINFLD